METSLFTDLANSMGLPTAIIVIFGLALWKVFRWLAPRIEKLFEAHFELVDDLRGHLARSSESNEETLKVSKETLSLLKETHDRRAI